MAQSPPVPVPHHHKVLVVEEPHVDGPVAPVSPGPILVVQGVQVAALPQDPARPLLAADDDDVACRDDGP